MVSKLLYLLTSLSYFIVMCQNSYITVLANTAFAYLPFCRYERAALKVVKCSLINVPYLLLIATYFCSDVAPEIALLN